MDFLIIFIFLLTLLYVLTAIVALVMRVPYVPTKKSAIKKIFDEAKLKKGETFMDLGCGDGRMLVYADKTKNISAIGYEIAPLVYLLALIRKFAYRSKAKIKYKNFFKDNLGKADVIFCYLMPRELEKLAKKILKECSKGTRIISNTFEISGLKPIKIIQKNKQKKIPKIYIYEI